MGTGANATTYTWNVRDQLNSIASSGFAASFTYDALGRRTGKTVQGVTTNYLYDGLNPVQEKNGATVTANLLTGLGIDEFLTRIDSSGTKALLPDGLGSTVALDDGTGSLPTQYTYEPFGSATNLGQASTNSYKYTGREDDGTGLVYYRARYYHPRLQRFLSEDPLGFEAGDPNLYAYVFTNPINYRDPSGLILEQVFPGPLDAHSNQAITYPEFTKYVGNQSLPDIMHAADGPSPRSDRSAGGPGDAFRYVKDPANPQVIIDMRHFLTVGRQGEAVGLAIEIIQALGGDRKSAFDPQDFYSNALGKKFFDKYDPKKPLKPQLDRFFKNRQQLNKRSSH